MGFPGPHEFTSHGYFKRRVYKIRTILGIFKEMMKNALQTQHDSAVSNLRNQRGRVQLLLLDLPLGHFGSSLHILPSVYNSHNHAVEAGENIVNVFLSLCY